MVKDLSLGVVGDGKTEGHPAPIAISVMRRSGKIFFMIAASLLRITSVITFADDENKMHTRIPCFIIQKIR